jgi:hypothetical protein
MGRQLALRRLARPACATAASIATPPKQRQIEAISSRSLIVAPRAKIAAARPILPPLLSEAGPYHHELK